MRSNKIIILSGLSGAGKTTGVHALEDLGFYCVDNLPVGLMLPFLELCERGEGIQKIALVIDIREGEFLSGAADMIRDLKTKGYPIEVLFLEAAEDILVRRYQETRRRHPAAPYADTLRGAIIKEREILTPLRQTAEGVIDTSSLNVHQLKRVIRERYQPQEGQHLSLCLLSFGFKHGLPPEADMALDVRFLPNPFFTELRHKTGQDAEVSAYALQDAATFLQLTEGLLRELLPRYQREGRTSFTLAIGCTGGKHRSVAVVEELSKRLGDITRPSVVHRDLDKL